LGTGEQDIYPYRPANNTERHIQTVVLGVILASLAWLGSIIVATHDSQIQLNTQLAEVTRRIQALELAAGTVVLRSEYDRETGVIVRKLDDVDVRVRKMETGRTR